MSKPLPFERADIKELARRYANARARRRLEAETMTITKAELNRLGFDEFGVSLRVRAQLREERIEKSVARSRKRIGR